MSTFLIIFMLMSSSLFLFLNHPLSFGLILLIQTILIALTTGLMSYNYWFSYIIFLIMIGGMLILFIYMTSVASNEKFSFSWKLMMFFSTLFMTLGILLMMDFYFFNLNQSSSDLMLMNLNLNWKLSLTKFINWNLMNNFYLIILYLLITLIMVVKITNIQYGPLRQKL